MTVEEIKQKKGRLYDDIYLLINRFVQDTGLYPKVSGEVNLTPELGGGISENIYVKVDVIL
jgi:hypothetical protein